MTAGLPGGRARQGSRPADGGRGDSAALAARQAAGRRLGQVRRERGLTQRELGRRIGYARTTIGSAETGGAGTPALWRRADDELAAGGELARCQAAVLAAAAAARRPVLRVIPGGPAGAAGPGPDPDVVVMAAGSCPHCASPLIVRAWLTGSA
jgi:DNA-binding XRE family transcriptional regulator